MRPTHTFIAPLILGWLQLTACSGQLGDAASDAAAGAGADGRATAGEPGEARGDLGSRGPATDGATDPASPASPAMKTQPPRYTCENPAAPPGFGGPTMRRLTRDELLATIEAEVGPAVMASDAVARAAARIPLEPPGDLIATFQHGHALDHVEGLLLTAEAVASQVLARDAVRDRLLSACARDADRSCAEAFLTGAARRFLRRPLPRARVDGMLAGFEAEGGGAEGMRWLLARTLQAPEMAFHLEAPRLTCDDDGVAAAPLTLAWDDASVFFAPDGQERVGPTPSIAQVGWYVWEIPPDRIAADYQHLRLSIAVAGAEAELAVNVNDGELLRGLHYPAGDHLLDTALDVAAGQGLKVGVYFVNGDGGASVSLRSLSLTADPAPARCQAVAGADGVHTVDAYTVASRLAFALTGRGPDPALLAAAAEDALGSEAEVLPHAERLLATPAGRTQLEAIVRAWLDLDAIPTPHHALAAQLGIEPAGLAEEAARELLDYAVYQVFERAADVGTLMAEPIGFPRSERMALLYGSAQSDGTTPVDLPGGHGGLLLRIAPLLSGQLGSSPILRGVYVRKRLLCDRLPSPDFTIVNSRLEQFEHEDRTRLSTREAVTEITAAEPCQSCHTQINPLGFALEPFGPLGMPRTEEVVYDPEGREIARHPIDATVEDPALEPFGPDHLEGPGELASALADSAKVKACIAERLYTHARLRPADGDDACMLAHVEQTLRAGGSVMDAWLAAVVNEQLFVREEDAP